MGWEGAFPDFGRTVDFTFVGDNEAAVGTVTFSPLTRGFGIDLLGSFAVNVDPNEKFAVNIFDGNGLLLDSTTVTLSGLHPTFLGYYSNSGIGHFTISGLVPTDWVLVIDNLAYVPEPSSVVLAALGLGGLVAWGWRRKRLAVVLTASLLCWMRLSIGYRPDLRTWRIGVNSFTVLVVLILTFGIPANCLAASYAVTDLGILPGGTTSFGLAINSLGQVSGEADTAPDAHGAREQHAFLYDGTMHDIGASVAPGSGINDSGHVVGGMTTSVVLYDGAAHTLGSLGGSAASGQAINNSDQVAGWALTPGMSNTAEHAILYDGAMHDLGTLGGSNSAALAINASGEVVGSSNLTGNAVTHAFLYDGTMHDLGSLGGGSQAWAVNASGLVAGSSYLEGDLVSHAFIYDGVMHDLGTLGGTNSNARGINASGQVVGASDTTGGTLQSGFLYDPVNGMVDLNSLINPSSGWFLGIATAINDAGQITGQGLINGRVDAYLLTPVAVPEPSSVVLAAFGLPA
jgi:probable HAF family extracellular repeat protein